MKHKQTDRQINMGAARRGCNEFLMYKAFATVEDKRYVYSYGLAIKAVGTRACLTVGNVFTQINV